MGKRATPGLAKSRMADTKFYLNKKIYFCFLFTDFPQSNAKRTGKHLYVAPFCSPAFCNTICLVQYVQVPVQFYSEGNALHASYFEKCESGFFPESETDTYRQISRLYLQRSRYSTQVHQVKGDARVGRRSAHAWGARTSPSACAAPVTSLFPGKSPPAAPPKVSQSRSKVRGKVCSSSCPG